MIPMKIQRKIIDWLGANGITASDVPLGAVPTLRNGRINCPVYLRRNGSHYVSDNGEMAKGTVDVPLLVEPADSDVRNWLARRVAA